MKRIAILTAFIVTSATASAEEPFHIYVPSPTTRQLWVIAATPSQQGLDLKVEDKIEMGFELRAITRHREKPMLYVAASGAKPGEAQAAAVRLNEKGGYNKHTNFTLKHGSAYLSTDRAKRFLLSADYFSGVVDVYALDAEGIPVKWVAGRDEGRLNAHAVLPSPDNRFVYIPYVKENNALLQYRFDANTGDLTPMEPWDAAPPAGTGPRHIAYHPTLPIVYFSNEQHLGVSVYDCDKNGQLKLRNTCDAVTPTEPKDGVSASDLVMDPSGRFLFAGIRGHTRDFDWIARYRIAANGDVSLLGRTPADKIPWGFTVSPGGEYLMVTAYEGGTICAYRIGNNGELEKCASLPCDKNIAGILAR